MNRATQQDGRAEGCLKFCNIKKRSLKHDPKHPKNHKENSSSERHERTVHFKGRLLGNIQNGTGTTKAQSFHPDSNQNLAIAHCRHPILQ